MIVDMGYWGTIGRLVCDHIVASIPMASTQVLAFVGRRLQAESVGVVLAARRAGDEVADLPQLVLEGLREDDAHALLDSVLAGPLDARVRDRFVAETRGNPLALLVLPLGLTPAQLGGGFGFTGFEPLSGCIEQAFQRRMEALPAETRRLLLVAAAEPAGEPLLVWRAAERLGIGTAAATAAAEAGLLEFRTRVLFRHPLVRSAVYRSAPLEQRLEVHRALAEVTDPERDPERRAWHRAQAAPGPDDDVAAELERSAGRAQSRGGLAAAAAFLERAAMLTREPTRRADRLLVAARTKCDAGALDAALGLLVAVEAGPPDALRTAKVEHLRGQIAMVQGRGADAVRLLLSAARRLEPLDACLARETHLESLAAAMWADNPDDPGLRVAADAARAAPAGPQPPRAIDGMIDAIAMRFTEGYAAAAPILTRALGLVLDFNCANHDVGRGPSLAGVSSSVNVAVELWDVDSSHVMAERLAQLGRDTGALVHLQYALDSLARSHLIAGELTAAALTIEEGRLIAEVTGNPRVTYAQMALEAWRGRDRQASELIEHTLREGTTRRLGRLVTFADYASSVLNNGLGRHAHARDTAWRAFERDLLGYGPHVVPELAEAASRTGERALVAAALDWLSERTSMTPTDWALGIESRVRALLSEGEPAERCYTASITHLGRTRARAQLARSHLLYGEWLRRDGRRIDARVQLRIALDMLDAMGIEAFAERARRELAATGETARKRAVQNTPQLTAQEAQTARLARDGLSNPEIGARLFISPRTVKYHLSKVFMKLDVTSRSQLDRVLPAD